MDAVFQDHKKRQLQKEVEEISILLKNTGFYLVEISARCKGEKQIGKTDDEDLTVEIDGRKFPKLSNSKRYSDSPAAFSGGRLHGFKKIVYFVLKLTQGKHTISLVSDISATFELINIFQISSEIAKDKFDLTLNVQAEDGDRRPWLTFVLVDLALPSFSVTATLKKRLFDSDDVKVIIDEKIKRSYRDKFRKLWYFVTSSIFGETQSETFTTNFLPALHYLEFWADRMPILQRITFTGLREHSREEIKEKIRQKTREYGLDRDLILRIVQKESSFDPLAVSPREAKGLFQLTDVTIKQIAKLGFQVTDPFNVDQNINGGLIYFKWLLSLYKGQQDQLEKTLAAWNWGMANFSENEPLDWKNMPDMPIETKEFIRFILQK